MEVNADLISRCGENDRRAQFELYKLCYALMMKICLRYLNNQDDAKATVNESFLKVCTHIGAYRSDVPFELWIRRITINTVIDQFRKNKKWNERLRHDMKDSQWPQDSHELNAIHAEMNAEALRKMIHALPSVSAQVFNLCVMDGYEYPEAASLLGISEATCRWHVHSARKKLQEMLMHEVALNTARQ